MIPDYLECLERELSFDRSLARSVRDEVEDHLWEAVAADRAGDTRKAQQRAIASFGDARLIAAGFAVTSLGIHSKRAGVVAVLVIASVFVAMKARVAWYAAAQWAIGDDMRAISGLVLLIDRYAFWLALVVGLGSWAYIQCGRIPATLHPAYRRQLHRFFLLCSLAAAALVVSVLGDAVLTSILLQQMTLSADFLVPIFSMAIEIACAGILIARLRGISLRQASVAALIGT